MAVRQPWFGEVHLCHAGAEIEVIALCGQAASDGAGADGNEYLAVFPEFAQYVHVFRIADAALDQADVA